LFWERFSIGNERSDRNDFRDGASYSNHCDWIPACIDLVVMTCKIGFYDQSEDATERGEDCPVEIGDICSNRIESNRISKNTPANKSQTLARKALFVPNSSNSLARNTKKLFECKFIENYLSVKLLAKRPLSNK
jgi:hypothetical protein